MKKNEVIQNALRLLAARCRRLTAMCYWAGTSSIAIEELGHRESFDLDFHTQKALVDVRPILAGCSRAAGLVLGLASSRRARLGLQRRAQVARRRADHACLTRDRFLSWLKTLPHRDEGSQR